MVKNLLRVRTIVAFPLENYVVLKSRRFRLGICRKSGRGRCMSVSVAVCVRICECPCLCLSVRPSARRRLRRSSAIHRNRRESLGIARELLGITKELLGISKELLGNY